MADSDDDDELGWSNELDQTKITSAARLPPEISRTVRDRAYLIMLTGSDVGKIFPLEQGECTIGRSHRATIRLDDDSISRVHCKVTMEGGSIAVEDLNSSNGTHVNGAKVERATVLKDGDKIRVGEVTILKFTFHDRLDESFQRHMYNAALRDGLTKAFNKRYFLDHVHKEIRYAARHGTPLCLIMVDLDHFKRVNDTYGHIAGDDVLVKLAGLTQNLLRAEDVFARYGGEEFGIIARGITLQQGGMLAERLRQRVEESAIDAAGHVLKVTLSLGVAVWQPHMDVPEKLVEAADLALYQAKHGGRNRVVLKQPV
jgi:diguanylate cyclase (GGDEF)-like protein